MHDIFKQKDNNCFNLRQVSGFSSPLVKLLYHRNENVSFLEPKIWGMLLDDYNDIGNLNTFKNKIKKWKPEIDIDVLIFQLIYSSVL